MRKIPEEMERMILEALQRGEMYKTRENGICRIKRNIEKVKDNYPQELLDEWDRVRLEILRKG